MSDLAYDLPGDQRTSDAQSLAVPGESLLPVPPTARAVPEVPSAGLADSLLLIFADALDDLEQTRIATENRVRSLRQVKQMEDTPEERRLVALVGALDALEHGAELELKRAMRAHPFGPWVKVTIGVGEKQGARLLAAIGDPYVRLDGTTRTVSQLWALCGYHVLHPGLSPLDTRRVRAGMDPSSSDAGRAEADAQGGVAGVAARRRKGEKANWNGTAKMRAFLIAESCIKQARSPYRAVYDDRRAHTAVSHPEWTAGHSHADGLRIVAKAVLRDLWIEGRRLHEISVTGPGGSGTVVETENAPGVSDGSKGPVTDRSTSRGAS